MPVMTWAVGAFWDVGSFDNVGDAGDRLTDSTGFNLTAGLNWYLYPDIRFMFNYVRANLEDRDNPTVDDGYLDMIMLRFQMSF